MAEEIRALSVEDLKRDVQAKFEREFPQFAPLSIRFDEFTPQGNGTFTDHVIRN